MTLLPWVGREEMTRRVEMREGVVLGSGINFSAGSVALMSGIHENKRGEMKEERNDNDEEHDGDGIDSIL